MVVAPFFLLSCVGAPDAAVPTDLSAAAAEAFAAAADDGTAAFCAPGRYTVVVDAELRFAMVSWGDRVALTLLTPSGRPGERHRRIAAAMGGDPPTVVLEHVVAASGARYRHPDGAEFWSRGTEARIVIGEDEFVGAAIEPLRVPVE